MKVGGPKSDMITQPWLQLMLLKLWLFGVLCGSVGENHLPIFSGRIPLQPHTTAETILGYTKHFHIRAYNVN